MLKVKTSRTVYSQEIPSILESIFTNNGDSPSQNVQKGSIYGSEERTGTQEDKINLNKI